MTPVFSCIFIRSWPMPVVVGLAALGILVVFRGVVSELVLVVLVASVSEMDQFLATAARLDIHGILFVFGFRHKRFVEWFGFCHIYKPGQFS